MLNANNKNLKVYGLDVPEVVVKELELDFEKEIKEGKKMIIDDDDNIPRFFKVLCRTVGKKNNVTYELLMFTFDVAKKAINGNNLVKDEKKIPGFTIDYIFHSLCWAIDNVKKESDVEKLNLTKDISDLIKQVLNNDGLVKKLTLNGIALMFSSLSYAIKKGDAKKIDIQIIFGLVKQVVDCDELIEVFNGKVAQMAIGLGICQMFDALSDAIKKVGTKGLDPKNVFELIGNVLVKYNTLKNVDLLVMFEVLLDVYATDQKQFGNVRAFVEQFGFKYVENKKELDFDDKKEEQLNSFLNSNSGQRKDLINKFMYKAKINIDFKWAEIDKETDKKVNEKGGKDERIGLEAELDNKIDKKTKGKEEKIEDNSGVNIIELQKEDHKQNENKKGENTEIIFEAKAFLQRVNSNKSEAPENNNFNTDFKNAIANVGLWEQIKAFVWAVLFKLCCVFRIYSPNASSLKKIAQTKELEYALNCGNLNDKQSAESFIKKYNLVKNNLEQPETMTESKLL